MNPKTWSDDDRSDFDELCHQAKESGDSTRERVDTFCDLMDEAANQAHRIFARDVEREARRRGMSSIFTGWEKRQAKPVVVAYNGEVLSKPRVVGTKVVDDEGAARDSQGLFDFMTWDDIARKRRDYIAQMKSYGADVAVMDKLLALHDLAPDAANPADAADQIGTTVEAWLADEAA